MNWYVLGAGAVATIIAAIFLPTKAAQKLPPPSANAAAVIKEIETGPDDWETTDSNGYFSYFYSPSRNLLLSVRPNLEESSSAENAIAVGRVDRIVEGRWWLQRSYSYSQPVGPPDSTNILNAARPHLKKAVEVNKTYPDALGPVVASHGEQPKQGY